MSHADYSGYMSNTVVSDCALRSHLKTEADGTSILILLQQSLRQEILQIMHWLLKFPHGHDLHHFCSHLISQSSHTA